LKQDITNKRVLAIAIPIVLSNITVPILGAVDTAVVGQLGKAAPVAAVGVGAIIITSFYWLFGFLRMGTTGLVAQAVGSEDESEIRSYLLRALILGFSAGPSYISTKNAISGNRVLVFSSLYPSRGISKQIRFYKGLECTCCD
jgi:MATE family multidrug resistance protein